MCTQLQIPKGDYADKDDFEFIFVPFVTRKTVIVTMHAIMG